MKSILFIEDDSSFTQSLKALFKKEYRIFSARNGKEGLDIIKKEKIDTCLLDYLMPEMNGDEVLPKIREINKNLPIIFLTAYPNLKLQTKVVDGKNGVQFFLPKPPNPDFLKEIVDVCATGEIIEQEKNIIKFTRNISKKKKDDKKRIPKNIRQIEIVRLIREEPDKWNMGKFSVRFSCTRMTIYKDFEELLRGGIKIKRTKNGYSIIE